MLAPNLAVGSVPVEALTAGTTPASKGNPLADLFDYVLTSAGGIVRDVVDLKRDELVADLAGLDHGPGSSQEQRPAAAETPNVTATPRFSTVEIAGLAAGGLAAVIGIVLLVK